MDYTIRKAVKSDLSAISDLFYEALTNVPELKEIGQEVTLKRPSLNKYIRDWGRKGDTAFVVESNGEVIGAAWCRLFTKENPSYGFVSEDIPELSISITSEARNKGIGTKLLEKFIDEAKSEGFKALSLSVDKHNDRALHLYSKLGFVDAEVAKPEDTSITLIKNF